MTPVVAYTDGSCRPDPRGDGTAAFLVVDPAGAILAQETMGPFPAANVGVVELVAIHAAMDWLLANGHYEACIRTDFQPVVLALRNGTVFGGAAAPHWVAVLEWIACFDRIDIEYVPRTTPGIQVCDRACQMARLQAPAHEPPRDRVAVTYAAGATA